MVLPACRRIVAMCGVASAIFVAPTGYGQSAQVPGAGDLVHAQQVPAPVDPGTLSCNALKAKLQGAGELNILSGPNGGWGDTFYGPAVPRCQFWQMPLFTYVHANDGLCGVGYICVEKMSFD